MNEKKGWFPEKFNKTDKPPAAMSRKKKEKDSLPILGMTNDIGKSTLDSIDIKYAARDYHNQLYANKLNKATKLKKKKPPERAIHPNLTQ